MNDKLIEHIDKLLSPVFMSCLAIIITCFASLIIIDLAWGYRKNCRYRELIVDNRFIAAITLIAITFAILAIVKSDAGTASMIKNSELNTSATISALKAEVTRQIEANQKMTGKYITVTQEATKITTSTMKYIDQKNESSNLMSLRGEIEVNLLKMKGIISEAETNPNIANGKRLILIDLETKVYEQGFAYKYIRNVNLRLTINKLYNDINTINDAIRAVKETDRVPMTPNENREAFFATKNDFIIKQCKISVLDGDNILKSDWWQNH